MGCNGLIGDLLSHELGIDQNDIKKKIKTLKKVSLLIPPLLMYLIRSNNLLSTKNRSVEKTKTTKKVLGIEVYENRVETKTFLQ